MQNKSLQQYKKKLEQAIEQEDVSKLIEYSTHPFAYINNQYRRRIYPVLLQHAFPAVEFDESSTGDDVDFTSVVSSEYLDQVEKDVNRSLYKFVTDLERSYLRTKLSNLVNKTLAITLSTDPSSSPASSIRPHYFQGYHELCSVLMLTLGEDLSYQLLSHYLIPHKKFLRTSLEHRTLEPILQQLKRIYSILIAIGEKEYAHYLRDCDLEQGHYALSWILTWYCHVIDELKIAQKIMDAIVANGSDFCIFLAVGMVLERKTEVLYRRISDDYEYDTYTTTSSASPATPTTNTGEISPPEFTQVFAILNRIPQEWCYSEEENDTKWDQIIQRAVQVKQRYERAVNNTMNKNQKGTWFIWAGLAVTFGVASIAYYSNTLLQHV